MSSVSLKIVEPTNGGLFVGSSQLVSNLKLYVTSMYFEHLISRMELKIFFGCQTGLAFILSQPNTDNAN